MYNVKEFSLNKPTNDDLSELVGKLYEAETTWDRQILADWQAT